MQEKEVLLLLCEVIESLLTVRDKSNLEIITSTCCQQKNHFRNNDSKESVRTRPLFRIVV